jgi:glycosyltransferase involved in cell wall biosynthesis
MKILHISYSLNEQSAAYRLAEEQAINQRHKIYFMLARKSKSTFIESRRISPFLTSFIGFTSHLFDHFLRRCFVRSDEVFSISINLPLKNFIFSRLVYKTNPDIIHIHWGGYSFITPSLLAKLSVFKGSRLIVTTHDYYYFTGGCHIPMDCPEHSNNCQSCPMARSLIGKKWISKNRNRINKLFLNTKTRFVTPSFYSNNYLKSSFKYIKSEVIANTVGNFYLLDRLSLKQVFIEFKQYRSLNNNIPTILVVGLKKSLHENKGADIILELVQRMIENKILFNIITVGEFLQLNITGTHLHFMDRSVDEMKQLYTIADICIVASRYETFSQVTLESIQFGTPVVAFDLTGPKDIINHGISGFLVPSFNIDVFCNTVFEKLDYKYLNEDLMIEAALNTSYKFSPSNIALMYQELYLNVSISNI